MDQETALAPEERQKMLLSSATIEGLDITGMCNSMSRIYRKGAELIGWICV